MVSEQAVGGLLTRASTAPPQGEPVMQINMKFVLTKERAQAGRGGTCSKYSEHTSKGDGAVGATGGTVLAQAVLGRQAVPDAMGEPDG